MNKWVDPLMVAMHQVIILTPLQSQERMNTTLQMPMWGGRMWAAGTLGTRPRPANTASPLEPVLPVELWAFWQLIFF